jgi:hypothetical protein
MAAREECAQCGLSDRPCHSLSFLALRNVVAVQVSDDANVMLNGFGTVVNSLKMRAKPYLPQICGTIKWRLNNKSAKIRQQAADLIARIAVVMRVSFSPCLHPFCMVHCATPSQDNWWDYHTCLYCSNA